jgi:hypothetical protein
MMTNRCIPTLMRRAAVYWILFPKVGINLLRHTIITIMSAALNWVSPAYPQLSHLLSSVIHI